MPLVSIIINVRNGAATLREAIDSVLQQTLQDWELIVWDDCSTDSSAAIVAQYSDPRIRSVDSIPRSG
jgi:glycosyltransferase involved in cell wall biosynthesis